MADTKQLPLGRYVDGIITRSWSDLERKFGPELQMVLQFDDKTIPPDINGKEIVSRVKLAPNSKADWRLLLHFCAFLDRAGILKFEQKHKEKTRTGAFTAMSDYLIENVDNITGIWDDEAKVLKGGKLVGNRLSFIVAKMTAWADPDKGRSWPNNWRHAVLHTNKDVKPIIFNIFEISHIEEVNSGAAFVDLAGNKEEVVDEIEEDDDVRWSYRKEEKARAQDTEEEPF